MIRCCQPAVHDALRATVEAFESGTTILGTADGLLYGNCVSPGCGSTICIQVCEICAVGCDANDRLPWTRRNPDGVVHVACVMRRALDRNLVTFTAAHQ